MFNRNSAFKLYHFLWNGELIRSSNKSEFHSNIAPYYPIELICNTISIVIFIQVYCCYWWAFFRYLEKFQSIFFLMINTLKLIEVFFRSRSIQVDVIIVILKAKHFQINIRHTYNFFVVFVLVKIRRLIGWLRKFFVSIDHVCNIICYLNAYMRSYLSFHKSFWCDRTIIFFFFHSSFGFFIWHWNVGNEKIWIVLQHSYSIA